MYPSQCIPAEEAHGATCPVLGSVKFDHLAKAVSAKFFL